MLHAQYLVNEKENKVIPTLKDGEGLTPRIYNLLKEDMTYPEYNLPEMV